MKYFLDTANLSDIEEIYKCGIVAGVTTNPTIMSREQDGGKTDLSEHYSKIREIIGNQPLSVEVLATETSAMVAEGETLAKQSDSHVIKIPCNSAGIAAVAQLSKKGIKTNCTLVFSLTQAISAMQAGATYISPFIGRLEDIGEDGLGLIKDCVNARDRYNFKTEIICTSIRSINHISECIRLGADIVTCTPEYFDKLMNHPLTDKGLEQFLSDFNASQK